MFAVNVNRKLLPLKICYFLMFACLGPVIGFSPTIARQLGYSFTTYGASITVIYMSSMAWTLFVGMLVDKYRVKKKLFTIVLVGIGVTPVFFMFIPKAPLNVVTELKCLSETVLTAVYTNNGPQTADGKPNVTGYHDSDKLMMCKLDCEETVFHYEKTKECDDWLVSVNGTDDLNKYAHIDVAIKLNDTKMVNNSYVFRLLSGQVEGTNVQLSMTCPCSLKTLCHYHCDDEAVMDAIAVKTYQGNVLNLYQFWMFFITLIAFNIFGVLSNILFNPICLDILDDKSVNFGKQKLWASLGWGSFSILIGWVVDLYSIGKKEKDYTPVFVSGIVLTILNLIVTRKIEVVESKKSDSSNSQDNILGLFAKHYVIVFIIWSVVCTFFHAIITHFLFWYMEDLVVTGDNPGQQAWLKTLQGLAQGVQCFGGEIPFFFWSGCIIKRLGYANCMALVLGAMAVRIYLYTVIWNPAWIVLIELLNGVSYALGFALKMSYAKTIAPPNTLNTIIGCISFFDCIGESLGSLVGGYLFDSYGGVWAFRFFACCSALACCLNMVVNFFGIIQDTGVIANTAENPTKIDVKKTCDTTDTDTRSEL